MALFLGACGEESGPVTVEATELVPSRVDYIIDADTICAQFEAGIRAEAEVTLGIDSNDFRLTRSGEVVFKPGRAPSQTELRRFGSRVLVPSLRDQLAELRALTPPAGDQARLAAIYDSAERGIDEIDRDPGLAADREGVRAALNQARRAARRYGFATCGAYSGP